MDKLDVLPVPPELVPQVWKSVRRVVLAKIPGYDIERTHARLLVGIDRLWVAYRGRWLGGVIITSISQRPPSNRNCFKRKDPELRKSLTIHVAGENWLLWWLDSAIERISHYAREQKCRQLFLLTRKGWQENVRRFYSREWEAVAIGRDRPTKSACKRLSFRNTPGYFRRLVPVPADKWDRYMYAFMSTYYFKEAA